MNKSKRHINMLDMSRITSYKARADQIKTTNINILLNKVRQNKRKDFKKKIIYTSLLVFVISLVGLFTSI
jgi:hypothetical protein